MLCDLGYVIVDHVPAMIQILTNELREYNMELISTRCFNTAVMMWYLFLGERQGSMEYASECECHSVRRRGMQTRRLLSVKEYARHPNNPSVVLEDLESSLLAAASSFAASTECSKNNNKNTVGAGCPESTVCSREIYYVILTNANLPRSVPSSSSNKNPLRDEQWFPGHVFVIEKSCRTEEGGAPRFNLYQSYINNYTLQGHALFNRSYSMSADKMRKTLRGMRALFQNPAWTQDDTSFWKKFTHVQVPQYEGYNFADNVFVCFRKANTTRCVDNLRNLLQKLSHNLEHKLSTKNAQPDKPYGNESLYTTFHQAKVPIKILSNQEMLGEMHSILSKL